jgi:hypothetical protein
MKIGRIVWKPYSSLTRVFCPIVVVEEEKDHKIVPFFMKEFAVFYGEDRTQLRSTPCLEERKSWKSIYLQDSAFQYHSYKNLRERAKK